MTDEAGPRHGRLGGARRRFRRAGAVSARGAGGLLRSTGSAARYTFGQVRRASRAEGAGDSGLYRLIELHVFNAAGDAAVAISLAGTLFFQVPTGEARGQVAQFLALTLLPFAVVAPLVGPLLDRFSHGRRWAIGGTMALRAFLCWVLADAVLTGSAVLFPAALGVLVASKAYSVTRASSVPRLLPPRLTLVKANSRISLAGVTGAALSAPPAVLAASVGAQWALRYAFLVFVVGTVLAVLLPARVDSSLGEEHLSFVSLARGARRIRARVPATVVFGLRCNAGLRLLSGFLTMFLAFLLRDAPFPGWETRPDLLIGLVIGAAGVGGTVGIAIGSLLRTARPDLMVAAVLLLDTVVIGVVAVVYSLPSALVVGVAAGLTQALGKLSLDALIQRDVPEPVRTSTFGRSETLLQLSWVLGGFLGIAMPLNPHLGLGAIAALLAVWAGLVLVAGHRVVATGRPETGVAVTARARRRGPGGASRSDGPSSGPGAGRRGIRPRSARAGGRDPR